MPLCYGLAQSTLAPDGMPVCKLTVVSTGTGGLSTVSAGLNLRLNEEVLPPPLGLSGAEESPLRYRLRLRSLVPHSPTAYYECAHGDAYCPAR